MGFISHHIMPLVINNLRDGDTHTHTHTRVRAYQHRKQKSNYKKHLNSQVTEKFGKMILKFEMAILLQR